MCQKSVFLAVFLQSPPTVTLPARGALC